jgi:UV DNA damage endonuclease
MLIRFGYVAMTLTLENCSPSKTITYKRFSEISDKEIQLHRLRKLTEENLENIRRILIHNQINDIKVFRLTSKIVPLATHPEVSFYNYVEDFKEKLAALGEYIKENNYRISAHPDHYTLLPSPREEVIEASVRDLDYHVKIFEAMGLDESQAKLVIHVGGGYKDKEKAKKTFEDNFNTLEGRIKNRITLENDDKTYTAVEVLELCNKLSIPMILDLHHHWCCNNGEEIEDLLEDIFNTWNNQSLPPKIHISSPKSDKDFRSHADDIEIGPLINFLEKAKKLDRDFDVMIEAKNKDVALFKLMEELKNIDFIKMIDKASIEI